MTKKPFLQTLTEQLSDVLPSQLGTLKKDLEKNFHSILNNAFSKLELVKREEFDTQTKVLARTRKKLEELTETVKKLEKQIHDKRQK